MVTKEQITEMIANKKNGRESELLEIDKQRIEEFLIEKFVGKGCTRASIYLKKDFHFSYILPLEDFKDFSIALYFPMSRKASAVKFLREKGYHVDDGIYNEIDVYLEAPEDEKFN